MSSQIELDHVGPIEHLTIPIPEGGGVVVLRGKNGSGKSHALNGVEALYSKESRKGLRNSDGMPSGKIEGLGVAVRLGRSNTAKGELICESLDGRVDPSLLVDPGIKDPLAADAKRLITLIRLAGVEVTRETWEAATCGLIDLNDLVDPDPVVSADSIRRALHAKALTDERAAESKAKEAATLEHSIADINLDVDNNMVQLAEDLDEATSRLARAEQQQSDHIAAKERQAKAVEALNALPELATEMRRQELLIASKKVDELVAQIESLQERLVDARGIVDKKQAELDAAEQREAERKQLADIVNTDIPAEVTTEQIEQLREAKTKAHERLQQCEVVKRALETKSKATDLKADAESCAACAARYRDLARSTDQVLEQALIDSGFNTVKVHDGRLCVESDRGLEPFSDLSHGERCRITFDIVVAGLPEHSVLPVRQEFFESLDPHNRAHLSQLAKERGLVIVTAEATDGDLRAEVLV